MVKNLDKRGGKTRPLPGNHPGKTGGPPGICQAVQAEYPLMARFRWTIEDMKTMSDTEILLGLVNERKSDLNHYTPFAQRLKIIAARLEKEVAAEPPRPRKH